MKQYGYLLLIALIWGLLFPVQTALAQQDIVNGSVTDRSGDPIAGIIITLEENSDVQTTTDTNGQFAISAKPGQHLKVFKNGESSETVTIRSDSVNITLDSNENIQNDYQVPQSSGDLIDAAITVNATDLPKGSSITAGNLLFGPLPGLMTLDNGSFPPTVKDLFIRGRGTFNNSTPLILIDGYERPFLSRSNLGGLTEEEVESITLIQDAAALTRYGQRGANGVLLITTKRGSRKGLQVTASVNTAVTQPTRLPSFVEAPYYARSVNEGLINDGKSARYGAAALEAFDEGTYPHLFPNVDWFDQVLRDYGTRSDFSVSFQGGGEIARYFTHLNLVNDNGLFGPVKRNPNYNSQLQYNRFNFRSNLDIEITDKLLLNVDIAGKLTERREPIMGGGSDQIFNALYTIPSGAFPVTTLDGNWGGTQIYSNNPMAMLTDRGFGQPNSRQYSLTGRLQRELSQWIEGLSAEVSAGYFNWGSFFERQSKSYSYESLTPVLDQSGNIVAAKSIILGQDTDLSFSDRFGHQRQFSDISGKINYHNTRGNNTIEASVLFNQSTRIFDGQDNAFFRRNFVGNVHFNLDGKYLFDVVTSYSGNNHLPQGNRYNFFPGVSAAWLLSEEDFLQDVSFLDRLKIRASWGISGNDLLPTNNPNEQSYNRAGGYRFKNSNDFQNGFAEGRLPTSDFTVETSYNTTVGIKAGLFGKLDFITNLFYARRTNILTGTDGSISDVIGIEKPLETDGIVENRGAEIALDWQDNVGEIAYRIGGQFSFARNEIIEMNEEFRPYDYLRRTGNSVGQEFGLQAIGFFEDQQDIENSPNQVFSEVRPGDIKYKDQNGDGIINENDEVPLGYSSGYPEIYFSGSLGFNYKGLDVSVLFQGTGNYTAYLNTQSVYWPLRNNNTISTYYYNNRWTSKTTDTATLPRLTTESNANNFRPNSIWLVDRSYIKLRTLEISYSLPLSVIEQWNMDEVRIFSRGMNLFSIDNIKTLDPEHLSAGYPILRSYSLGLEVVF